jgi:hypothetical protein
MVGVSAESLESLWCDCTLFIREEFVDFEVNKALLTAVSGRNGLIEATASIRSDWPNMLGKSRKCTTWACR